MLVILTLILVSLIIIFGKPFAKGYYMLIMVAIGYGVAICLGGHSLALLRYTEHQKTLIKINFSAQIWHVWRCYWISGNTHFYGGLVLNNGKKTFENFPIYFI